MNFIADMSVLSCFIVAFVIAFLLFVLVRASSRSNDTAIQPSFPNVQQKAKSKKPPEATPYIRQVAEGLPKQQQLQLQHLLFQQAADTYKAARGTQHKRMLRRAKKKLDARCDPLLTKQAEILARIKKLQKKKDKTLHQHFATLLVNERLQEVSGIGNARKKQLLDHFNGNITSLRNAHLWADGVGTQTSEALNLWIKERQAELRQLEQQPFAERETLVGEYERQLASEKAELAKIKSQLSQLAVLDEKLEEALAPLTKITPKKLSESYINGSSDEQTSHYLRGVFAEWEAVPVWFQEVMEL